MNKTSVSIKGMHCKSCEILIEDESKRIPNVNKVDISHKTGIAEIYYKGPVLENFEVTQAVKNAGYEIGENNKSPFFSKNTRDYSELFIVIIIAVLLFLIGNEIGLFQIASSVKGEYSNLFVVFLVGLTAGISTCMALVGGLILAVAGRYTQDHLQSSSSVKFTPHLLFNAGRIVGFFILGGIIGQAGLVFHISTSFLGGLTAIVGLVMVFLGLQLIGYLSSCFINFAYVA